MTVLELPTPDPRTFDDESRPFVDAIKSRYAVKRVIGKGGMGIVYLARDRRIERLVAIKTLPPHLAADESMRQRFLRETRTAGAMSHPNVVPIYGADDVDGHVFFVMGYVDGDSLAARIRGMGRLAPETVARILRDVASALVHAHERGIVHRDIKAENILVDRETERALVTDFGIARVVEAQPLTATGQMLGTVHYVSPEQIAGERIDARSDLYSLGVVGFLALTGRFPFDDELASAVLVAHVNRPAPAVRSINPNVPPALAAIVDRCLAKKPDARYASASALLSALQTPHLFESKPALRVSDTEAQVVWDRAAFLQASTESRPLPEVTPVARDVDADRRRMSGHLVDNVRDAGREAGIGTRFIDRALAERGLGSDAHSVAHRPVARSWWAGAPIEISESTTVAGELAPRDFDRIIGLLRDGTGSMGMMTANTREIGWRAEWFGHGLEASIAPAGGVTKIQLRERLRGAAAATMATSVAVIGGVVGPVAAIITDAIFRAPTPHWLRSTLPRFDLHRGDVKWMAASVGIATAMISIPIGRKIVRHFYRSHAARVRMTAEAIAANVRALARDRGED
jgi:predicted Ser/Thr protein kinase